MRTAALLKLRSDVEQKDEDPFKDGDVIRWKRRYDGTRKTYLYAALRAGGRWFITGPQSERSGLSYEMLVRRHLSVEGVRKISIATEWVPVEQKPASKRAKMAAETGYHERFCRHSGMSFKQIPRSDDMCACPGGGYEMAGKGFDESVHG